MEFLLLYLLGTRETMALKIAVSREIAIGDELERDANMCTAVCVFTELATMVLVIYLGYWCTYMY